MAAGWELTTNAKFVSPRKIRARLQGKKHAFVYALHMMYDVRLYTYSTNRKI